ncbi:MAG: hypothetical protein AB7O50_00605 [Pseudolabrys sp.]
MQRSSNFMRAAALPIAAAVLLSACTPDYMVRRETISLNGGDAIATNRATQMVDPWSRASAEKDIAFNGQKMQSAVERYRTNKVIPPRGISTSGSYTPQGPDPAAAQPPAPVGPTPAAAPVK